MTKYHISRDGVPAPCRAKLGNCPLGNDSQHFESEGDAQAYVDSLSGEKYGVLPEIKQEELSEEWKQRFLQHTNFDSFVREYARDVVADNIFEGSDNLQRASSKKWKDLHYENSLGELSELDDETAIKTIRDNVEPSALHGWFREYNSDYKPRIENAIITNPKLRNASLNVAHKNYKEVTGDNISYNDFLNKDLEVYRGGNFSFIDNDVFVSYSFDRRIAEKFSSGSSNAEVQKIKIKARDTLGSLQTTGEAEIMIRR